MRNANHSVDQICDELRRAKSVDASEAYVMPSSYYTSEEFFEFENENLSRKEWVCLGRGGEIPKKGDYFTTDLIGEPLLVCRDSSDQVRVLSNVCRHRGNIIASGVGNSSRFTCSYHAWTYKNDGQLVGAPLMESVKNFDKANCRLPEFACEIWQGFIYVNLDGKAKPLAPRLEALMPHIKNYDLQDRTYVYGEEEIWQTNWKCLTENFMEGYHLDFTHPTTLKPITPTKLCKKLPAGEGYNAYISGYDPNTPGRGPYPPNLTEEEQRYSMMFGIFPCHVVGLAPNNCVYLCLRPVSADSVAVKWGICSVLKEPGEDIVQNYVELMQKINSEDKAKLETLQRGLKSRTVTQGPLGPHDLEGTIWDMYLYMAGHLVNDQAVGS